MFCPNYLYFTEIDFEKSSLLTIEHNYCCVMKEQIE